MKFETEVEVAAPLDTVWDVFSDLERAAERIQGITKIDMLTPAPMGKGTRWRETRTMFGKEATEEMEITAFDAPRSYVAEAESCGAHYSSKFNFEEQDQGVRVRMLMETRPLTFMARLMTPLGFLFAGSMKKMMRRDMEDLKRAAEAGATSAAPSA